MCLLSWNTLEFTAVCLWYNKTIFLYIIKRTVHGYIFGNIKLISRVEQDISLFRFAHKWDIVVNTQNQFHISKHPSIFYWPKGYLWGKRNFQQIKQTFVLKQKCFAHCGPWIYCTWGSYVLWKAISFHLKVFYLVKW